MLVGWQTSKPRWRLEVSVFFISSLGKTDILLFMYLLGKVDVSCRNLTMMNDIHHREYVIQSICVKRTVVYMVAFSRTAIERERDQAMNSSRSASIPYVQFTRIDLLLISISILFFLFLYEINIAIAPGRGKKDYSSYCKRYPVRIPLIDIISSLHSRFCTHSTRTCIHHL